MRLDVRPRIGSDSIGVAPPVWDTRVLSANKVGRDWIARFAKFVATQSTFDPNSVCAPGGDSSAPGNQLILGVRLGSGDGAPSAIAMFREQCIELQEGAAAVGRVGIGADKRNLLSLAHEALPGDEVVRRLSEAFPLARQISEPRVEGSRPKLGDHVFVEELPEAITRVAPQYPAEAFKAGVDGTVLVQALVGPDGSVEDVQVQKSIPILDAAAVACVYQWRFKPALSKGMPVAVWVAVPVRFTLH